MAHWSVPLSRSNSPFLANAALPPVSEAEEAMKLLLLILERLKTLPEIGQEPNADHRFYQDIIDLQIFKGSVQSHLHNPVGRRRPQIPSQIQRVPQNPEILYPHSTNGDINS